MNRYFIYARKSQDRSDRQVASIDSQIDEMTRLAKERGYIVIDVLTEQQSAKQPGRPVFTRMIERIQKGEANGILCWKLNRLARNPVDAGTISWLLQGNVIQAICSKERTYLPSDNVLMMQIDFGIANQFIKDLRGDVLRGTRSKAKNGWMPQSILPVGYLHHPKKQNARNQIICDPVRFPIVKELWKLIETGAYSIMDLKLMAEQMGLVNKNKKPYALNTFHLLFNNPVYYGKFYWKDDKGTTILYQGKHKPMVSEHQFRKVQSILKGKSVHQNRFRKHDFIYRGAITCGECESHVTAERKLQAICTECKHKYSIVTSDICRKCKTPLSKMKNPSLIDITYYYCTRNKNPNCRQGSITETKLEEQVLLALRSITLPDELFDWFKSHIEAFARSKHQDTEILLDSLRRKKGTIQQKVRDLLDLQLSGEIPKDQGTTMRSSYERQVKEIDETIFRKENALSITLYESHTYLNFAQNCSDRFENGSDKEKKELVHYFCSNLVLFNKSLYFTPKKAPEVLVLLQKMLGSELENSNVK